MGAKAKRRALLKARRLVRSAVQTSAQADVRHEPLELNRRYRRVGALDLRQVEGQSENTIDLAFSSESTQVLRWDREMGVCPEVLSHDPGACDLSPLLEAGSVLRNHDPDQVVATPLSAEISADRRGRARIQFGSTQRSKDCQQEVRDKLLRGVSFGYEITGLERIKPGQTRQLGNTRIAGPAVIATRWSVYELTLTSIPADASVGVGRGNTPPVSGPATKGRPMNEQERQRFLAACKAAGLSEAYARGIIDAGTSFADASAALAQRLAEPNFQREVSPPAPAPAPVTPPANPSDAQRERIAEKERCRGIRAAVVAAKLPDTLADELIEKDVPLDQARAKIIEALAKADGGAVSRGRESVEVGADNVDKRFRFLGTNLARRVGVMAPDDQAHKDVERAHISLHRCAEEMLALAGVPHVREMPASELWAMLFRSRGIRAGAANTSADLANLLANVQDKALIKGYQIAKPTWREWCKKGSLSNFQIAKRIQLNDLAQLRETGENGEILDSKLADRAENIQLAYYARSISLTEQMFINDDLGALSDLPMRMGRSAAQLPSRLVYAHLLANGNMGDGNALFDASNHLNYFDGAASPLAYGSLGTAIQMFRQQVAPKAPNDTEFPSEPIDVSPRFLLVPPELEATAKNLIGVALTTKDGSEFLDISNLAFVRSLGLIPLVEARLSHTGYTGYSTTAWYLLGDPAEVDTVEVAFLNGQENPATMAWQDFNVLALRYRAVLAVGVKALDWRGMVKSKGTT